MEQHISIWCSKLNQLSIDRSLIINRFQTFKKQLKIKLGLSKSDRSDDPNNQLFGKIKKILQYSKDQNNKLYYLVQLEDQSIVELANSDLLRSKLGSSISKQGYRLRKRKLISFYHMNNQLNHDQEQINHQNQRTDHESIITNQNINLLSTNYIELTNDQPLQQNEIEQNHATIVDQGMNLLSITSDQ